MTLFIQSLLNEDYKALETKLFIVAIMWLLVAISVVMDLISGWRKAKQRGEARTSYGLRQTVTKLIRYYSLMTFAFLFDCIGTFFYPYPYITMIGAGFLIFIEGKSILEKAHEKDKKKLNDSLNDLSIILDNQDDLIRGLTELLKKQSNNSKNNDDGDTETN